jgi:hypothetical protein
MIIYAYIYIIYKQYVDRSTSTGRLKPHAMEPILAATKGANTCREAREPPGHVGLITFLSDISLRWKNNMDVILPYYPNHDILYHIIIKNWAWKTEESLNTQTRYYHLQ